MLHIPVKTSKAKPFIKWVGGKGQLLATFEKLLPEGLARMEAFYM